MTRTEDPHPPTLIPPAREPPAPEPAPDDSRVVRALEEYAAALKAGQRPDRQEFQGRYPEIAEALADCLEGLEFVQAAAPQLQSSADARLAAAPASEFCPEGPLGDYRIVREIGRGGMGVVYEAVQVSLGRQVALKVLPFAAALDAKHLQRFKNEAQAAAHLQHQNIVPVYGIGCARGVHYYAMQFIDGQTLANLIAERRQRERGPQASLAASVGAPPHLHTPPADQPEVPAAAPNPAPAAAETAIPPGTATSTGHATAAAAYFRTVANLGVQAAEALEHAHQLGVVHRDVKPGNLLVDARGNLWITDFGLAQFHSEGNLTRTGDLLGTLRYMSPEQAQAQPLDHRTDVYSLGVTLYELLTLEAAFDGSDRQALLHQVAFEEPRPPRRVCKAVPEELETIVVKAMEKNPAERYATAQALADDLRRFLEDRPIWARRPSLLHKARKLARRNKGVVWTAVLALALLLVLVAVAASVEVVRLAREEKAALRQLDFTREAETQARRQLYRALVQQARASRLSRRMGQRFDSLQVLEKAVRMAREMKLPEEDFRELRSEVIACLALPDLRIAKEWDGWPPGSLSIDFDGTLERYARVDRQGVVHIHRVADGNEISHFPTGYGPSHYGPGETIPIFSPDGQFLLLGRADRLKVWKLADREPVLILEQSACTGDSYRFSPDSRRLVLAQTGDSIHLYELPSGRRLQRLQAGLAIRYLAFHPKGRQLAISHAGGVQVRDLATGDVLAELAQSAGGWHVAGHPDGKTLAVVGSDRSIHLWDVASRKPLTRLEGHKSDGIGFAFNRAGDVLISGCWDGVFRLWDTRTGRQLFSSSQVGVHVYRLGSDDQLLAVGRDARKLGLSQIALSHVYRTLVRDPIRVAGEYRVCATAPEDRLLAVGMSDGVGLWDLASGKALASLPVRGTVVEFATSDALLTNGPVGLLRWPIHRDLAAGLVRIGPPQTLPMPGNDCWIGASRDGQVVASPQHWGGLVWRQERAGAPIRLSPHVDTRYITVSPDGSWVATGSHWGTKVKIWDARTGKFAHELPVETGSWVHFSPDGRWLATSGGGSRLWAVDSWREGPLLGGGMLAFSRDGKLVAVETGHGVIRLVDPDTGREYARLEDPNQDRSGHLCFSSDGAQLISTTHDSPSIHVWDLRMIRRQLAEMGLDWDLPPYPPARAPKAHPLRVTVDLGDLGTRGPKIEKATDRHK